MCEAQKRLKKNFKRSDLNGQRKGATIIVTVRDELPSRWRELVQTDTLVGSVDTGGCSIRGVVRPDQ